MVVREEEDADPPLLPALAEPSKFHLPDITRWAASATASAMIEPSLVALDTMLLAAWDAVSAASSPASRIFLRAAGLAAIAAAAAVNPAASISLLIAALASLSIVSLDLERDDDDWRPTSSTPGRNAKNWNGKNSCVGTWPSFLSLRRDKRHFKAVSVPE